MFCIADILHECRKKSAWQRFTENIPGPIYSPIYHQFVFITRCLWIIYSMVWIVTITMRTYPPHHFYKATYPPHHIYKADIPPSSYLQGGHTPLIISTRRTYSLFISTRRTYSPHHFYKADKLPSSFLQGGHTPLFISTRRTRGATRDISSPSLMCKPWVFSILVDWNEPNNCARRNGFEGETHVNEGACRFVGHCIIRTGFWSDLSSRQDKLCFQCVSWMSRWNL